MEKKYYFEIANDINMEGLAIPPIGTISYPFIGNFKGNYHVISNLYITNNKTELKEYFDFSQVDLGNKVGFFGVIDSPTRPYDPNTAGFASEFYLENVNISNSVNNSVIGIIAGHNNGNLNDIGVSNNSFKLINGITSESNFVLIGELGEYTQWIGTPSNLGNKILIDPNDPEQIFTPLSASSPPREVVGSVPEHAYFTPELGVASGAPNALYKVTNIDSNGTPTSIVRVSDLATATNNGIPEEFWNRYYEKYSTNDSKTAYIIPSPSYPNPVPSSDDTVEVDFEGDKISIPKYGIWFKPKGPGTCGIAFSMTNLSDDSAMAVYEFSRDLSGNIIDWKENRFEIPKKNNLNLKNSDVLYFDYEVKENYEYLVGRSTVSPNTAGFFYLTLHGAGYQDEGKSTIENIDFVMRESNNQFPIISAENYKLNNTLLTFDGISASTGLMYFNKNIFNSRTAVYYYSAVDLVIIRETTSGTPDSAQADESNLDAIFYNWMANYLNDP
ncbi:MAG TPA: hypothetical protein GX692_07235 [Acholeplasmataceae bacterium]|nr:hypothetical protein [Acholeplasmataceae bacterium]